jgi:uroporphyrinogen decarboxylase
MRLKPMAPTAQLALETILHRPAEGIPSWMIHVMEHSVLERVAGARPGDYRREPEKVYLAFQRAAGTCLLDQYIPHNPLSMGERGHENPERGATTGAEEVVLDGMRIDSPEAVVAHLEQWVFPRLRERAGTFDEDRHVKDVLAREATIQHTLGPGILKSGHGLVGLPTLAYGDYGYVHYFTALALYPDVIEQHFSLQADLAVLTNRAIARAYVEGDLPPLHRLDHDVADSRSTLVRPATLDRLWMPHLARALEPMRKTDVRMIWHCDGNLMELVPRLLDVGIKGFQGFQYEDGMDYARICRMKARDGDGLTIIGGVSVTRTLPFGTPADVRREMAWLVDQGPRTGLFLGASSSIAPGVPFRNIQALIEGLQYYQKHGRR